MSRNGKLMLGYMNFEDLASSLFGLKASAATAIGAFFATVTSLITQYIWDDARAIYILLTLIIFDAITGILKALKYGTFNYRRLPRILVTTVLYTGMLAVSWNLAKVSPIYFWVPSVLYGGFVVTSTLSVFENMYMLGYIPDHIYKTITEKAGLVQTFMFGKKFQEAKSTEISKPVPFGVWHADKNGTLIFVNDRTCKILGLDRDEAMRQNEWYHSMDPEDMIRVATAWHQAVAAKRTFTANYRVIRKDGTSVNVKSTAAPIMDEHGEVISYIGTMVEVDNKNEKHEIIH